MNKEFGKKRIRASAGDKGSLLRALTVGTVVSVALTVGLTALESAAAEKQIVSLEFASSLAYAVWLLPAAAGALAAAKIAGGRRLPVAILTGGAYALALLLVTGLLHQAKFHGVLKGILTILVGAAGAGVLASGGRGTKTAKHRFR